MDSAVRDQIMIMFPGRPFVYVLLRIERLTRYLGFIQCVDHLIRVHARFQTEVNGCILSGIQQIIAFVLCIIDAERITDILGSRVYLQTEVAPSHRIQEVEADREILSEARFDRASQQVTGLIKYKIIRGHLKQFAFYFQVQAVLFGHAVETPAEVCLFLIEVADFLHPLSSPGGRVEERNHTERFTGCLFQSGTQGFAGYHFRHTGDMSVQPVIGFR